MKTLPWLLAMMALAASPSWAANDSREKQMLRRMQQQMQQLDQARAQSEQERAAALADKETAERELEKARSDEAARKRQLAGERAARSRTETELKALQAESEALKARLADSVALQQVTAQTLAQVESAKKQTEGQLAGKAHDLQACQTHNGRLYAVGREMMDKYRDKSCQDALAQVEPFTGLKKVEVENLLEAWRDKLDRERLGAAGQP